MELLQVSKSPPGSSSEVHSLHWPKQRAFVSRLAGLWNCCRRCSFFCQKVPNSPSFICKCHSSSCGSCSGTYSCCWLTTSPNPTTIVSSPTPAPAADSRPNIWTFYCLSFMNTSPCNKCVTYSLRKSYSLSFLETVTTVLQIQWIFSLLFDSDLSCDFLLY
jgi:hypothetical protein